MSSAKPTHLVLIPSYNTGPKLFETVREACDFWGSVWVVVDGSTDGAGSELERMARSYSGLRVIVLAKNKGKGAAILHGICAAQALGYTHVLTMDADGQHPASYIPEFMAISAANPRALVLGKPLFDSSAPWVRVAGRKLSNWWADVETLWAGIGDSLFGFRVYPIAELRNTMEATRWMRRFDFDAEAAIRLCWLRLQPINKPVPVRYFRPEEGGVSHFNYLRDNILLVWMHGRLLAGFALRLILLRPVRTWRR